MKHRALFILLFVALLVSAWALPVAAQTGSGDFETIRKAGEAYLTSGKPMMITAEELYAKLTDADKANDPFLLDVCAAADYLKGHIPGAINVVRPVTFNAENLAKYPKDRQIVVYCYTGTGSSYPAMALNMAGYNAVSLQFGKSSWTRDETAASGRFNPAKDVFKYPVKTDVVAAKGPFKLPTVNTGASTPNDVIIAAAKAYLTSEWGKAVSQPANKLFENLNDGDDSNNPTILDVRTPEQYAKGHIPGAINIPLKELAKTENLAKLDPAKEVWVVDGAGQTSGFGSMLLNMLGYKATIVKYGMTAWTADAAVAPGAFDNAKDSHDYPFATGDQPGAMPTTAAAPAAAPAAATPAPAAMPKTGAPLIALLLAGLGLTAAGVALRRK